MKFEVHGKSYSAIEHQSVDEDEDDSENESISEL